MSNPEERASTQKSPRDPEARRGAIVQAAADLLVESGDLTHRLVAARAQIPLGSTTYYFASLAELRAAALEHLANELVTELAQMQQELAAADGDPAVLAGLLHDYLSDADQVRADAALYSNAAHDPALRRLALRWFDGFVEMVSQWTDPVTARNIAVFVDGASLHALLTGTPLDRSALTSALTALLGIRNEDA